MKTPQLITTALLPNTQIKNSPLAYEGKSGAAFDKFLNKEVRNNQKKELNTKAPSIPAERKYQATQKTQVLPSNLNTQINKSNEVKKDADLNDENAQDKWLADDQDPIQFFGQFDQFKMQETNSRKMQPEGDDSREQIIVETTSRNSIRSDLTTDANEDTNLSNDLFRTQNGAPQTNSTDFSQNTAAKSSTGLLSLDQPGDDSQASQNLSLDEMRKHGLRALDPEKHISNHQLTAPMTASFSTNSIDDSVRSNETPTNRLLSSSDATFQMSDFTFGENTRNIALDSDSYFGKLNNQQVDNAKLDARRLQTKAALEVSQQHPHFSGREIGRAQLDTIQQESIKPISNNLDGRSFTNSSVIAGAHIAVRKSDFRENIDSLSATNTDSTTSRNNDRFTELEVSQSKNILDHDNTSKNNNAGNDDVNTAIIQANHIDEPLSPSAPPKFNVMLESVTASTTVHTISPHIGTRDWSQSIGQKLIWMNNNGEQSALLTLNPPDLGPLQINLSVNNQFVDASFISSNLSVREAIEAAVPRLRELMDNAGMSLSGFSVGAEAAGSHKQFFQADSQDRNSSGSKNPMHFLNDNNSNAGSNFATRNRGTELTSGNGLVDTFV